MKNINIKSIIREFNLPKNTKLSGLVVNLIESDEYLVGVEGNADSFEVRAFSPIPDLAYVFDNHKDAKNAAAQCHQKTEIGILLDANKHWMVIPYKEWC